MARVQPDGSSPVNTGAVDAPENPAAENAATKAMKPRTTTVEGGAPMPQIAPVGAQPAGSDTTVAGNADPAAYKPPPQAAPQATENAIAATSGMASAPSDLSASLAAFQTSQGQATPSGSAPPLKDAGGLAAKLSALGNVGVPQTAQKELVKSNDNVTQVSGLMKDMSSQLPQAAPSGPQVGTTASPFVSWQDPKTGEQKLTAGSELPQGVHGYQTAPLIQNTAGGNMSAQGDAANSFRGFTTAQGGGFGGAFAGKQNPQLWSAVNNRDPKSVASALESGDPELEQFAATQMSKFLTMNDTQGLGTSILENLSPAAQEKVKQVFLSANGGYQQGEAGFDPNRANASGMYQQSWDKAMGAKNARQFEANSALARNKGYAVKGDGSVIANGQWDTPIGNVNDPAFAATLGAQDQKAAMPDTGPQSGNWMAADPAEQQKLLAQLQSPSPSGPQGGNAPQSQASALASLTSGGRTPAQTGDPRVKGGPNMGAVDGQETAVGGGRIIPEQTGNFPAVAPSGGGGQAPATASGMGNVAQTAVTPENALTNQMLSRGAGADRFKIAKDQWDAWQKSTNPEYEASTRDALRKAAAGGAIGSGMLNTSLGDLTSNRQNQMDAQKQNFLSEALKGTIADQFGDVGIAQQQQGFQNNQQQTAFGNEVQKQTLQEMLTQGAFGRDLSRLTAGSTGDPSDMAYQLSQMFGNQSGAAGSSLAALLSGMGARSGGGTQQVQSGGQGQQGGGNGISDWLQKLFSGGDNFGGGAAQVEQNAQDTFKPDYSGFGGSQTVRPQPRPNATPAPVGAGKWDNKYDPYSGGVTY